MIVMIVSCWIYLSIHMHSFISSSHIIAMHKTPCPGLNSYLFLYFPILVLSLYMHQYL